MKPTSSVNIAIGSERKLIAPAKRAGLPGYPVAGFFSLQLGDTKVGFKQLSVYVLLNLLNMTIATVTAISSLFQQIGPGSITLGSVITALGGGYTILRVISWALGTQPPRIIFGD